MSDMEGDTERECMTLRILTMNVHKGFSFFNRRFMLPELRTAVRRVEADIVFLQEVIGIHHSHSLLHDDWPDQPQYEFLAESLWPQFAYGRNAIYPQGHHGNALLSRFPIRCYQNMDVTIGKEERRGLLHCALHIPTLDREVHVICVHLGLREFHRQLQAALLCELVATLPPDMPVIVAGDFNDWRLKVHPLLAANASLHEVFVQSFGRTERTFPARWPLLRLDRIYVRNVVSHRPIVLPSHAWAHLSDHAPLAAEVVI